MGAGCKSSWKRRAQEESGKSVVEALEDGEKSKEDFEMSTGATTEALEGAHEVVDNL